MIDRVATMLDYELWALRRVFEAVTGLWVARALRSRAIRAANVESIYQSVEALRTARNAA